MTAFEHTHDLKNIFAAHQARRCSLSYKDHATLLKFLQRALNGAERNHRIMAVLLIEISDATQKFSTLGHDGYLVYYEQFLAQLYTGLRLTDDLIPLSVTHCAVILDQINDYHGAATVARRLSECANLAPCNTQIHIGINCYPMSMQSLQHFLQEAETALQNAKRLRTPYCYYSADLQYQDEQQQQLLLELQRGLETQQFYLRFQPVIAINSGKIVAVEALLRWGHPSLDIIGAEFFMPLAEQAGLQIPITNWTLEELGQSIKHALKMENHFDIYCKVDPAILLNQNMLIALEKQVDSLPGSLRTSLIFTIDERKLPRQAHVHALCLAAVQKLGTRLCLENFGLEYCVLASLPHPALTTIKLPAQLCYQVNNNLQQQKTILAFVALARSVGCQILAPIVENTATLQWYKHHGVDFVQSYTLAPPVTIEVLADMMKIPFSFSDVARTNKK